jgi:hypothetical protein
METVLGLLGFAVYIVATVSLAAAVTYGVVKLSPSQSQKELEAKQATAKSGS